MKIENKRSGSIINILAVLGLASLIGLCLVHAQDTATLTQAGAASLNDTNVNWNSLSDFEVELKLIEATPTISAADLASQGLWGTFYSAQHLNDWPPLPGDILNLPVWEIDTNLFLIDDTNFDYAAAQAKATTTAGVMQAMDNGSGGGFSPDFSFPSNALWLQINNVSNGLVYLTLNNTTNGVEYQIISQEALSNAPLSSWNAEGPMFWGSETTNWTATTVAQNGRSNLFLSAQSQIDSTGTGIPDWWWLLYYGQDTNVNAYADPAGDGWNNLEKYQLGMNPNLFYTPPAPQGLTVDYDSANGNVNVSWLPSSGAVTNYLVQKFDGQTGQTTYFSITPPTDNLGDSVTDSAYLWPDFLASLNVQYQIQAQYTRGNSAWSDPVLLEPNYNTSDYFLNAILPVQLVAGPQGSAYLAAAALPPGTVKLRLNRVDYYAENGYGNSSYNTNFDIPLSAFTNGLYLLPTAWTTPGADPYGGAEYTWSVQTVDTNGNLSESAILSSGTGDSPISPGDAYLEQTVPLNWIVPPYFDGRVQLKQNLIFLLRSATVDLPFYFTENLVTISNPTNYAYSGFNSPYENGGSLVGGDILSPFQNNYVYENFVLNSAYLSSGYLMTGVGGAYDMGGLTLANPPTNTFQAPTLNGATIPAVLATNQTQWLCSYPLDSSYPYLGEIGVSYNTNTQVYSMASNARNIYGLPFLSVNISGTATLYAGNNTTQGGYFYPQTAQPQFHTVEYDFWNLSPLPGATNFSTSQPSDLLTAAVGNPMTVNGYAKLAMTNGYPGVYAYLGQYFDQAYHIDDNGNVTTNTTGVVSPYGNFFPTQPGPAALVTMPDVDTGQRGTCTVYCVSLVLDKNHDGTMDTSFSGPDNTSASSPMIFWANQNFDRWDYDSADGTNYEDSLDPSQVGQLPAYQQVPDCNYVNASGQRVIPDSRDLEDFARLWVCGVTSNLLAALPAGSTVTLNWGDVGNPNSGNPTIDIFQAADTDGGIGYLTNETVADEQTNIAQCPYLGRLGPGGSLLLNSSQFANDWAGNHFIWCGVSNGVGQLNLTIMDASNNVLAQASQWIQIVDIKQMYERWTVGDSPNYPPMATPVPAADDLPTNVMQQPFLYSTNTIPGTPYILFVHGWNMSRHDKDNFAETAFKRLYWQGYQGRFGSFQWPTDYGFIGLYSVLTNKDEADNFDNSEYQAWQSGTGLLNLLTMLDAEYQSSNVYLLAHSLGNVVAGEALRLAGTNQVVNTYAATQAAVTAHTYDTNVPDYSFYIGIISFGPDTPNIYGNWFAGNYGGGAGSVVSFYNTNDYALSRYHWQYDQLVKPDQNVLENGDRWTYGYSGSPNDPPPWNNFYKEDTNSTIYGFNIVTSLNNRYEVMAYAAQSYTTALGATPSVLNVRRDVDLTRVNSPIWPPDPTGNDYTEHFWHSAEFRGDNAMMQGYWSELLGPEAFNLQ